MGVDLDGRTVRLAISAHAIDDCTYLAFARTSGVSDAFEPVTDEAPNNRRALRVAAGDACANGSVRSQ